jgi:hypothetical protein
MVRAEVIMELCHEKILAFVQESVDSLFQNDFISKQPPYQLHRFTTLHEHVLVVVREKAVELRDVALKQIKRWIKQSCMMTCGCFAGMTGVGQSIIDVDPTADLPGLDFMRASYMGTLTRRHMTARAFAEIIFDLYLFELEEFIRGPSLTAALLPFTSEVLLSEDDETRSARVALEARREAAVTTAQALEAAFPPRPVFPVQQPDAEDP